MVVAFESFDRSDSTPLFTDPTYVASDACQLSSSVYTMVRIPIDPMVHTFRPGTELRVVISAPGGGQMGVRNRRPRSTDDGAHGRLHALGPGRERRPGCQRDDGPAFVRKPAGRAVPDVSERGESQLRAPEARCGHGLVAGSPRVSLVIDGAGWDDRAVGSLDGKVAIVTGGAGGIGAATARAIARAGGSVAVVDIDGPRADEVARTIGTAAEQRVRPAGGPVGRGVRAGHDRRNRRSLRARRRPAQQRGVDRVRFLSRDTQVTDLGLDVWERTMAVNLRSQMLMCKHAVPEMVANGGGSIINMSSGASLKGDATRTAYGVSKAGVNTLSMYVATAHGKQGVRVNTIVPGLILTDAVRAHLTERMLDGLGRATLTPYVGEPDDVANLVVFLASDASRYITGQMIAIDGGMSAHVGSAGRDGA